MKSQLLLLPLIWLLLGCELPFARPNEPFFCKINGKVFRPEKDTSPFGGVGGEPLSAIWDRNDGWLSISGYNDPEHLLIALKLDTIQLKKEGEYQLGPAAGKSKAYLIFKNKNLVSTSGELTISVEMDSKISGTFEFTCIDSTTNKTYKITKGEFNDLFYP